MYPQWHDDPTTIDPNSVNRMTVTYHPPANMPETCPLPKEELTWVVQRKLLGEERYCRKRKATFPCGVMWDNRNLPTGFIDNKPSEDSVTVHMIHDKTIVEIYMSHYSGSFDLFYDKPFPINTGPQEWKCGYEKGRNVKWVEGVKVTLLDVNPAPFNTQTFPECTGTSHCEEKTNALAARDDARAAKIIDDVPDECPICFDVIVDGVTPWGCSHQFCADCGKCKHPTCPICRKYKLN